MRSDIGFYGIFCMHYHAEDIDFECAEGIPHFISYNAGTRVLNTYPEVHSAYILLIYTHICVVPV